MDFVPAMHHCLREHGIRLPFQFSYTGHFCDDLRQWTHSLGPGKKCGCFNCRRRPYLNAIEEEAWEKIRLKESDRGR